jgi:hypothetical protein
MNWPPARSKLARDAGALTVLPVVLEYRAAVHLHAGEFAAAAPNPPPGETAPLLGSLLTGTDRFTDVAYEVEIFSPNAAGLRRRVSADRDALYECVVEGAARSSIATGRGGWVVPVMPLVGGSASSGRLPARQSLLLAGGLISSWPWWCC